MESTRLKVIGDPICKYCQRHKEKQVIEAIGLIRYLDCQCNGAKEERNKIQIEREKEEKAKEDFERRREATKLISLSNIDEVLREKTFDSYKPRNKNQNQAKDYLMQYSKDLILGEKKGMYLYGNKGTGKTHLALSVANTVLNMFVFQK